MCQGDVSGDTFLDRFPARCVRGYVPVTQRLWETFRVLRVVDEMKKSAWLLVILVCLNILAGCASLAEEDAREVGGGEEAAEEGTLEVGYEELWADSDGMKAIVISDLHYTEYKEVDPALVPGIAVAEEFTDALVAEVIDCKPDVLIMTGDNTNSGYSGDVAGLAEKLQKVRDNGISIVMTTGNHDFDMMGAEEFEEAYFGLVEAADRDPNSLSYTAVVKDVVFLAMDDNAVEPGGAGEFSALTMKWIEEMLDKYRDRKVIFLSHHNVLYGYGEEDSSSHLIQNPELADLLRQGGVKLAMTGHMHFQYVTEEDGLWEVLSGMPFSGAHLIGRLVVEGGRAVYFARPIDLARYGEAVKVKLDELDSESEEYMEEVFAEVLEREGVRGGRKKKVLKLIARFMRFYGEGSLAEHVQEVREDPSCELMIKALWNYNYGPWMKEMLENTKWSGREWEVVWEGP